MDKIWSIIDIINWGVEYFEKKNISNPRLNIELLLCEVLQNDRMNLYLNYEKPLNEDELALLKKFVLRRAKHEPLQYITGYTNFLGYKINVDSNVLIPRPETELLVDEVRKKYNNDEKLKILDIGTGSGCISISLADFFKNSHIDAVDYSNDVIKIAKSNAEYNNTDNISFIKLDILSEEPSGQYDIIISNPPYISDSEFKICEPEVLYFEPHTSLTDNNDGYTFYKRFESLFQDLLKPEGEFFLEIGFGQMDYLNILFSRSYDIQFKSDFNNIPRIISGKLKNVNSELKLG